MYSCLVVGAASSGKTTFIRSVRSNSWCRPDDESFLTDKGWIKMRLIEALPETIPASGYDSVIVLTDASSIDLEKMCQLQFPANVPVIECITKMDSKDPQGRHLAELGITQAKAVAKLVDRELVSISSNSNYHVHKPIAFALSQVCGATLIHDE